MCLLSMIACMAKNKKLMKWQPYLTLMAKKPMANKYTEFYEKLPPEWQDSMPL
jgi:hypothetical protein